MSKHKKNAVAIIDNTKNQIDIKHTAWLSLSPETKKAYQYDYDLFFKFIKKSVKDVSAQDILAYMEYLEQNDYKNTSINRKVASLSKLFKMHVMAGDIRVNPVDVLKQIKTVSKRVSTGVQVPLTLEDVKKAVKIPKNSSDQETKLVLIIKMLVKTGLRISEFTGIRDKDIKDYDDTNKIIRILGKGQKERFIYIENSFLKEIKKSYPDDLMEYLFYNMKNKRYSRKVLWRQIKEFFQEQTGKDVWPHMLRHVFATHKINIEKKDIKSVSKFLGHADVSTTLNSYVDTALDVNDSKMKI